MSDKETVARLRAELAEAHAAIVNLTVEWHKCEIALEKARREAAEWRRVNVIDTRRAVKRALSARAVARYARRVKAERDAARDGLDLMTARAAELERRLAAERKTALEDAAQIVEAWAKNYPADIFKSDGTSRDDVAGTALRLVIPNIAADIRVQLTLRAALTGADKPATANFDPLSDVSSPALRRMAKTKPAPEQERE